MVTTHAAARSLLYQLAAEHTEWRGSRSAGRMSMILRRPGQREYRATLQLVGGEWLDYSPMGRERWWREWCAAARQRATFVTEETGVHFDDAVDAIVEEVLYRETAHNSCIGKVLWQVDRDPEDLWQKFPAPGLASDWKQTPTLARRAFAATPYWETQRKTSRVEGRRIRFLNDVAVGIHQWYLSNADILPEDP